MELLYTITNLEASVALLLLTAPLAYHVFASRWSACTGNYVTQGKVLWSSFDYVGGTSRAEKVGIVDFNYWVDGELFHSNYHCPKGMEEYYVNKYPSGSTIPVYFSVKNPDYCVIDKPPSSFQILFSAVQSFIITPLLVVNTVLFLLRQL